MYCDSCIVYFASCVFSVYLMIGSGKIPFKSAKMPMYQDETLDKTGDLLVNALKPSTDEELDMLYSHKEVDPPMWSKIS